MDNIKSINLSCLCDFTDTLYAGDAVLLSGIVYTSRDAAHKHIFELLDNNQPIPFDLKGATVYYAGPTPARPGQIIGSCGPTTSSRMDFFTPRLLSLGLKAMIGKGERSAEVIAAIKKYSAVYFCAVGGAGALISKAITSSTEIAFPELGCESVKKLIVKDFPVFVGIDSKGNSIFDK
jgi:fumarate hydratase subunit beta